MKRLISSLLTVLFLLMLAEVGIAQNKVPLTYEDFDQWKSISGQTLTPDGRFLIYALNPQEGDGAIKVQNLRNNNEVSHVRGERFEVSYDGQTLVHFITAPYADVRQVLINGEKPDEEFDDTLAVYSIYERDLETFPEVGSFKLPERSGAWLAYLYDRDTEEEDENGSESAEEEETAAEADSAETEPPVIEHELVLRNLETGEETMIEYVEDYFFSRHGERLVYVTADEDSLQTPGVHILETETGTTRTISSGLQSYTSVVMDSTASRIAFLARPADEKEENGDEEETEEEKEEADEDAEPEFYTLYFWEKGMEEAKVLVDESSDLLSEGWMVNEYASPEFSHNGNRLFFGIAPEPMRRDTTVEKIDIASVDIWNWKDDRLQPQQLLQLEDDKKKTYKSVYHIEEESFIQLEDDEMRTITVPDRGDADYAIGTHNLPYMYLMQWEGFPIYNDVYWVDVKTGERKQFGEKVKASLSLSPGGTYAAWYDYEDRNWYTKNLETQAVVTLTGDLDVPFYDELHDSPSDPSPYGVEGWTKNDNRIVIRDRYDLWVFDPSGKEDPYMLTNGHGRENEITYRSFSEDPDSRWFASDEVWLMATYESDKSSAVHRADFEGGSTPKELWRGDYRLYTPQKAREDNRWMVRMSTFQEYPDIHITDNRFRKFEQVTNANPQQENYLWGDVELFNYMSLDGEPLDALLYTPENFDPEKKYPMVVYFYERTSDRLHTYRAPAPSASTITPAFYTSRGYIVAMPDITYKIGNPGRSAEDAVIGMSLNLIEQGFVDEDNIGLQGQSWGGYQIAHIITRTNMFKAAMAGAPVVNMTSAYGGIRWGSGLNRQFQYEKTQSRIGGTLWEKPLYYIENSPLFFADRVETPLLMMHNDADGAVPWYQGIEFFTALKRLNRPVWMLTYNDEAHNLRKRVNRKDLQRRMQQFFDHYLMDAPAPVWMKYGIPAIEKGINQGFELEE
ncbi:prolyl oligopeptidase family serine peptidase [Gracilimonas sp. Q87]|uniref:S9 family peptidase n=1 Tax=Gracilimonas sp. Q87 TaxID=3384766 RepID=UPI003984117E